MDTACGPSRRFSIENAGTIRPAPGRSALLLIGVAIPVYNQNRSRFFGLFAPLNSNKEESECENTSVRFSNFAPPGNITTMSSNDEVDIVDRARSVIGNTLETASQVG